MDDWIFLVVGFILLICTLFGLLIYSGLFIIVDVKTGKPHIGKAHIAYKDGTGPYSGVGSYFSESTSIAPSLKQIGLYYDDPAVVPDEKCRWAVGAVLAEGDDLVDETIRDAYAKENYKFMTLPEVQNSVNCVFPYATMVSIYIAVQRVYPKLGAYIKEYGLNAHPIIELYYGGYIHFMAPLSDQGKFYTPKAMESEATEPSASEDELSKSADAEVPEEPVKMEETSQDVQTPTSEDKPLSESKSATPSDSDSDGSFEKIEAEN